MKILFMIISLLLISSTSYYNDETLDNIINKCQAQWGMTDYATDCIVDQINELKIFEENYMPYLKKYEFDLDKIKKDIRSSIVFYCFYSNYDEHFDIFNFGLINVCCGEYFKALELKEKEQK